MASQRTEPARPVFADADGRLHSALGLHAVGRSGSEVWELASSDLIPLPSGADLFYAVGRVPLGLNPDTGDLEEIYPTDDSARIYPVAAILPAGFTRLLLPAWRREDGADLPLYGYTAVANQGGELVVAARQTDDHQRWNPLHYSSSKLPGLIRRLEERLGGNRILKQLAHCAQEYHCLTAANLFYGRWEAGIPTSPACNAHCLGCISLQESGCCPSPQSRITFSPSADEIVAVGVHHLTYAEDPIISFGQGCEGEPLLRGVDLCEAISRIRERVSTGTINLNSNASRPDIVGKLAEAGLDSIRVSLLSANDGVYNAYHRPQGYSLADVRKSIAVAGESGVFVSLNLLAMPGFTDQEAEIKALFRLLDELPIGMIQLRNLNIDPDIFFDQMQIPTAEGIGIDALISELEQRYPSVRIGSFSTPTRRRMP